MVGFLVRLISLLFAYVFLSVSACLAENIDKDQRTRWLNLHKLATDVKELNRCTAVVSVEDLAAFEPIVKTYNRKTDELAKAIDDFATRYADRRSKQETVFGFRYRIWDVVLQAGAEKARPVSALNRDICTALTR
jgi:hypothetical protein